MIIAWSDVIVEQLKPNKHEFMVLICDGIWNCISNEELISFVAKQLKQLTNYRKYANNYSLDYCRQSCLRRESLVKKTRLIWSLSSSKTIRKKDRFQRIHFWEFEIYLFSKSKPKKTLESHPNLNVVFNRQLSYRIKDFSNDLNLSSNKYKWTQNFCLNLFDLCLIDNTLKK